MPLSAGAADSESESLRPGGQAAGSSCTVTQAAPAARLLTAGVSDSDWQPEPARGCYYRDGWPPPPGAARDRDAQQARVTVPVSLSLGEAAHHDDHDPTGPWQAMNR